MQETIKKISIRFLYFQLDEEHKPWNKQKYIDSVVNDVRRKYKEILGKADGITGQCVIKITLLSGLLSKNGHNYIYQYIYFTEISLNWPCVVLDNQIKCFYSMLLNRTL